MRFEWDPVKAAQNRRKHGVTFEEALTVFSDPLTFIEPDGLIPSASRFLDCLRIQGCFAVYVERQHEETIRIISARRATAHERRVYEEG